MAAVTNNAGYRISGVPGNPRSPRQSEQVAAAAASAERKRSRAAIFGTYSQTMG
jgi:hypothetical protein